MADGDEYDSVMNYPLMSGIHDYFLDSSMDKQEFEYMVNRCYTMYMQQNNNVLFNLLDSHDTERLMNRFHDLDIFTSSWPCSLPFREVRAFIMGQRSPWREVLTRTAAGACPGMRSVQEIYGADEPDEGTDPSEADRGGMPQPAFPFPGSVREQAVCGIYQAG